jgi:transcription antitermination factor NusG
MLGFKVDRFEGFGAKDFAAFQESKWSSNRFNLERMSARAKMDALGKAVFERLGIGDSGIVLRTTLDHPNILNRNRVSYCWAYFDRHDKERTEIQRVIDRDLTTKEKVDDPAPENHVMVFGVGIDSAETRVFLRLSAAAALDRKNMLARLADPVEGAQFQVLASRVAPQFIWLVNGEQRPAPTDSESLLAFRKALEAAHSCLELACVWPSTDPVPADETFIEVAAERLNSVLAIWNFAAWSKTNDRLKLKTVLKEEKKTLVKRTAGFAEGDEVLVTGGLLSGKRGKVMEVDAKGRVRISVGRLSIEVEAKLLKKA